MHPAYDHLKIINWTSAAGRGLMDEMTTKTAETATITDTITGAQALWAALVREGVTDVFGYPGGAILPAYDAMRGYPIRHVLVRHEQGATHMADGYPRARGTVAVATAASGPGATNMGTGSGTAQMDAPPTA